MAPSGSHLEIKSVQDTNGKRPKSDPVIGENEDMLNNVVAFNFKIILIYQWQMKHKL